MGKIGQSLIRRSLPVLFRPDCSEALTRLGSSYGGWTVPLSRLSSTSVCYSFGVGEDVTFDLALANKVGCTVRLFDPTPRSKAHIQLLEQARSGNAEAVAKLGPVYAGQSLNALGLLRFHDVGLWFEDCELAFYEPADRAHVSHSVVNLQGTKVGFRAKVRSLRSIANDLGHDHIDFVKMDIEGAETAVLDDLLQNGPVPDCLCIEFDAFAHGGIKSIRDMRALVHRMSGCGLTLAHAENWNFLFLK